MARTKRAEAERAILYYRSIPPYDQRQRRTEATGVGTVRLGWLVQNWNVQQTPVENWAWPVAFDGMTVPQ